MLACWLTDAIMTPTPAFSPVCPPQLYLLLSAFYSLNRQKQKKKKKFFVVYLQLQSLCCTWLRLTELREAITSGLLLTVNSPYFGSESNSIHNWKWLLWSIWYAFVLPTSATATLPGGCSWGICFFFFFSPSCHFSPPSLFALSFDAFFSMTIHTSVEIALHFDFSQNGLLSSCLCLDPILPSFPCFFFFFLFCFFFFLSHIKCFLLCEHMHSYYVALFVSKWSLSSPFNVPEVWEYVT